MSFITDKQTLDDLNVLGKYKGNSMFSLFNLAHTAGGEKLLDTMFQHPLTNAGAINTRSCIFRYFQDQGLVFPFNKEQFAVMETYLHDTAGGNLLVIGISTLRKQLLALTVRDEDYEKILNGIKATIAIAGSLYRFINKLKGLNDDHPYFEQVKIVQNTFADKRLEWLKNEQASPSLTFSAVVKYEHLFRHLLYAEMKALLQLIYELDVYIAVGNVAGSKGFSYAQALTQTGAVLTAQELRYPGLDKAVGNAISFSQHSNLIFLTGANMAGKSTFMKSLGVNIYLAHMGFPVAAKSMQFTVKSGIYSSINVPDNLNLGLSHFYAEVLRVKKVAEEVRSGKDLVIIFDELFKGTNVKDAYDATLGVTAAFAAHRNCIFVISTHIIEVGEALRQYEHMQFLYLPTVMEGNIPKYTYKLQQGITADRQGMTIIENEKILEILK